MSPLYDPPLTGFCVPNTSRAFLNKTRKPPTPVDWGQVTGAALATGTFGPDQCQAV